MLRVCFLICLGFIAAVSSKRCYTQKCKTRRNECTPSVIKKPINALSTVGIMKDRVNILGMHIQAPPIRIAQLKNVNIQIMMVKLLCVIGGMKVVIHLVECPLLL